MSGLTDAFDYVAHAPRKLIEAGEDAYNATEEFLEHTGIRGTINHAVSDLDDSLGGVIGDTTAAIEDYSAEGME